jgi:hypothetical protein
MRANICAGAHLKSVGSAPGLSYYTDMTYSHWFTGIALFAALTGTAAATATEDYDTHLCQTAQRLIINANDQFPVIEQRGNSNGFHTIQMNVDEERQAVVIAMTTHYTTYDEIKQPTYIGCKMVNRQRVNDVLQLQLPEPDRACADINRATLELALAQLTPQQRERYKNAGRQLRFGEDALTQSGAEWLPVTMDSYISVDDANDITVRAPSVRVPWNKDERNFYQGTQHCKLISLAATHRWVSAAAFDANSSFLPLTDTECTTPHSMSSNVGSCLFYFAPADSRFCQDYSGTDWNTESAQKECSARHASKAALAEVQNRYEGNGGVFSSSACAERTDAPDISGTCVFHCRAGDETLWHVNGPVDPRMTRGCDLFVEPD